ncbi:MAG: PKD domain-containing protein [Methanosarcina mazei]
MNAKTIERTCFLLAILILILVPDVGMASELHVKAGESIQGVVDKALPGDTIFIEPGEFNESILINKENLTIKSSSGNPDNTIIKGINAESYVFEITAIGVNISGFSITEGRCGVFLNRVDNCTVNDNKISNLEAGIYLFESSNNLLSNNMVYSNLDCGIKLLSSPDNVIYRNYFNNTNNARDNKFNTWNDSRGNYWSDYEGSDENGDGIGDSAYAVNPEAGSMDYMPLMEYLHSSPVLPTARFTSDITEGFAPLSVRFKDFSENATSRLWMFGDGNTSDSPSPLHTFFNEGEYIVSLIVSNENDSDSASVTIRALNASRQSDPVLPEAKLISNATGGRVPLVIKFVDLSRNADCITWSFGDGKKSCCPEPEHTFCCPGNYTVSLVAGNENGTSTTCIAISVLKNETDMNTKENLEGEGASGTENKGLIGCITRYIGGTSDEVQDDNEVQDENTDAEATGNSEPVDESKRIIQGIIHKGELESIKSSVVSTKDSVVSAASSKVHTETGISLENGTLRVQKSIEGFIDNHAPESSKNSLPEMKKRIAPWVPSFLGLAGVAFMVSMLKRGRRSRK